MSDIDFGESNWIKVTKGSLGGKFVIPSDVKTVKYKIPTISDFKLKPLFLNPSQIKDIEVINNKKTK